MYTDEGNLDWLFFSEPVFPIRDGGKFPSFVHTQKGTTQTNLRSSTWFWDSMTRNPESFHAIIMIFSDRGTPKTYRNSDIFGLNTYKFTHAPPHNGVGIPASFSYVKIHMKPDEGVENITQEQATVTAGQDPDFHSRDLFNAIDQAARGNPEYKFPSWTVSAQIMNPASAEAYKYNIFDPTKIWPQDDFPLVPFGRITLNKNVTNYFSEVEQASFSPTAIVPGWDVTADPILQTRLFAYGETARYRLGINFPQFPVNAPKYSYNPTRRDGAGNVSNYGSEPSYVPYVDQPPVVDAKQYEAPSHEEWVGRVTSFESTVQDIDYEQPRALWNMFVENKDGKNQDKALVSNVAVDLSRAEKVVRDRAYDVFAKIDVNLGALISKATEKLVQVPLTKKPELALKGVHIPEGTSVAGGKPDNGQSQTA